MEKKLYRTDIRVYATAYIRATCAEEAAKIATGLQHATLEVISTGNSEIEISGLQFDSPMLPDVSMSPAMTIDIETPIDPDMIEEVD